MTRNFFHQSRSDDRSWSITIEDNSFTISQEVNFGDPKTSTKKYPGAIECQQAAEKLIAKKIGEGYEEVPLVIPGVPVATLYTVYTVQQKRGDKLELYQTAGSESLMELVCTLTTLEQLTLQQITVLPEAMGNLQQLRRLNIDNSPGLTLIPDSIGSLTALTSLSIGHTGITEIPESIGRLQHLNSLAIHNNRQLKELPAAIGQLKQLSMLTAFHNSNTSNTIPLGIPESLGDLENLERLNLADNHLTGLPVSIANLQELGFLELSKNKFTNVPAVVFQLPNLYLLNMEDCQLTEVPRELCSLKELEYVNFERNNITNIPQVIVEQGWEAIKPFLENGNSTAAGTITGKKDDPTQRLAAEYQAAHGAIIPPVLNQFILSGAMSASGPFVFKDDRQRIRKGCFITDIGSRMHGMADQLIRITVADLSNNTEPIGFADVEPVDGADDYTYQLIIFPKTGFPVPADEDPSPVYLVKYKGYPSEEEDYDEEFAEEETGGEGTGFDCSLHEIAGSFKEFISAINDHKAQ